MDSLSSHRPPEPSPPDPPAEKTNGWRETALEEYRTLRAEIATSIATQQTILGFGTATLGLVIGPGLALWGGSTMMFSLIFALFVPLLSAIIVSIWWGEVIRMVRAGDAVAGLEQAINTHGGWTRPALNWESHLRKVRAPPEADSCSAPGLQGDTPRSSPGDLRLLARLTRSRDRNDRTLGTFVLNNRSVFAAFVLIAVVSTAVAMLNDYEAGDGIRASTFALSGLAIALGVLATGSAVSRWRACNREWKMLNKARSEPLNA